MCTWSSTLTSKWALVLLWIHTLCYEYHSTDPMQLYQLTVSLNYTFPSPLSDIRTYISDARQFKHNMQMDRLVWTNFNCKYLTSIWMFYLNLSYATYRSWHIQEVLGSQYVIINSYTFMKLKIFSPRTQFPQSLSVRSSHIYDLWHHETQRLVFSRKVDVI